MTPKRPERAYYVREDQSDRGGAVGALILLAVFGAPIYWSFKVHWLLGIAVILALTIAVLILVRYIVLPLYQWLRLAEVAEEVRYEEERRDIRIALRRVNAESRSRSVRFYPIRDEIKKQNDPDEPSDVAR